MRSMCLPVEGREWQLSHWQERNSKFKWLWPQFPMCEVMRWNGVRNHQGWCHHHQPWTLTSTETSFISSLFYYLCEQVRISGLARRHIICETRLALYCMMRDLMISHVRRVCQFAKYGLSLHEQHYMSGLEPRVTIRANKKWETWEED